MLTAIVSFLVSYIATDAGLAIVGTFLARSGASPLAVGAAKTLLPLVAKAISKAAKGHPLTTEDKAALAEYEKNFPDYFGSGWRH